jgi:hypothetical protein
MYNTTSYKLARGLGWFSVALGAAELLMPGALNRSLGMREHNTLVRGFGLREIAAGLGILLARDPTPWVWSRVAGDALDLASLASSLDSDNPRRGSAVAAFLSVAAVTAMDVFCARSLGTQIAYRELPRRDYSDRSGFRNGADQMRGAANAVGSARAGKRASSA